jgi:hypothetical protein
LSATAIDAKITKAGTLSAAARRPGFPSARLTANVGNVDGPLWDGWKLSARWTIRTSAAATAQHPPNGDGTFSTRLRLSYELIDARLALAHDKLEVALSENLANEAANLGDNRSIAAETPGRPRLIVNQPRTIGLEFRQSF